MNATELTNSLKDIVSMKKAEGLTQKEISERVGEPQQMRSWPLSLGHGLAGTKKSFEGSPE